MANISRQIGDGWFATPGTCEQTGNNAPKFPWSGSPVGRFGRVAVMCCAYHCGYDDDCMAKLHQFPPSKGLLKVFLRLTPWFPLHYDTVREERAAVIGYDGPIEPFNAGDVENRLRYCFAKPGRRGHDPKARLYGVSVEHHLSTFQHKPGGRAEVFARCSVEVCRRLLIGEEVSFEEAESWGRG